MEPLKQAAKSLLQLFNRLSFNQKIALGTLLIAAIAVTGLFFQTGQHDFDVMFSGLDEADAESVVYSLRKQGIPYRLSDNGTTIMVPSRQKEELRLGAFKDDLIKSDNTLGFDALGTLPFGLTSWQEEKYDQKMMSDEVVKTLERIEGIKKARVILAQPKKSVFEEDGSDPSASVMIIAEPGFRLKGAQIRTVRQLVAHSVAGLKVENVTVADSSGNTLGDENSPGQGGSGETEIDIKRNAFEKQKAKDITELLTPLVGPNNVVVKVNAVMNFDQVESKTKRVIPSGGNAENPTGIPISVQNRLEDYNGPKPNGSQGATGVSGNVPTLSVTAENANASGNQNLYRNQQITTNYDVSTEEKTTIEAPGKVEKLSIAVAVNKVLTKEQQKELETLITSAGGIDPARGDSLSISGMAFSPEVEQANQLSVDFLKQSDMNAFILNIASIGGLFVLGFIALFLFYKILSSVSASLTNGYESNYDYDDSSYFSGGGSSAALPSLASASLGAHNDVLQSLQANSPDPMSFNAPALAAKLDPEIETMKSAISGMVQKDPADAARLIQMYIKEG
jgi:flagellar M-ring protein FliF